MKKKSFLLIAVLALAIFTLAACGGDKTPADNGGNEANNPPAENYNLSFASGGVSGTYYPYSGALATVWGQAVPGVKVNVQATGASAENIQLVSKNEADIAIVQNDVMKYAYDGIESFSSGAVKGYSTMATVYAEVCQIVVDPASGIKTVADLKGKRVSVGDLGSGVEANAKQILATAGLTFDDINTQHLGFGPSADAMKDKKVDAFFVTAGIPTTAVMEFAATNKMEMLSLDQETINKLKETYSFYTAFTIPASTYSGLAADVQTVAVKATIIVNDTLPEDLVYKLTKALFDNKQKIADAHAKGLELDVNAAVEGVSVDLHPGAAKYYKEIGVIK